MRKTDIHVNSLEFPLRTKEIQSCTGLLSVTEHREAELPCFPLRGTAGANCCLGHTEGSEVNQVSDCWRKGKEYHLPKQLHTSFFFLQFSFP